MPYCPVCRGEYRAGFTNCKTCAGQPALVEVLPEADTLSAEEIESARPVGFSAEGAGLVEIDGKRLDPTRVFMLGTATDLRDLLLENAIAAAIVPIDDVEFPDNVTRFEVRVRESDYPRAQEAVTAAWKEQVAAEGLEAGDASDVEKCPACGSHVPLDVEECPDCGLVVGTGADRQAAEAAETA